MHPATLYIYTDLENGIPENTPTCPACYLKHLQKYYPDSPLTKHLTKDAQELAEYRKAYDDIRKTADKYYLLYSELNDKNK